MTHNQIDYWNLKESERHNEATEFETHRHNVADETFNIMDLGERKRHNLVTEDIGYGNLDLGWANLSETSRHNRATEGLGQGQLDLGYANLGLGYNQLGETQRHNYATEGLTSTQLAEQARHNRSSEGLQAQSNEIQRTMNEYTHQYQTTMGNAATSNAAQQVQANNNQQWFNQKMNEYYTTSNEIKQQEANTRQYEAETNRYKAGIYGLQQIAPYVGGAQVPYVEGGTATPLLPMK